MLGNYRAIYEAQSNVKSLRSGRGGGDIITSLGAFLFDKSFTSQILSVKMDQEYPYRAIPAFSQSKADFLRCAGSKYAYVEYNDYRGILDNRSVLVGLPCQLPRTSTAYLKLGLFCGLNTTDAKLDYLLKWNNILKEDIVYLDWRSPETKLLEIRLKSGKVLQLEHWYLNFFFPRPKCLYCTDYSAHFADIAIGDRIQDKSVVLVRTERGEMIFRQAISDGYINANKITMDSFFKYRMSPLLQKEIRGGFINNPFVRCHGDWIKHIDPSILNYVGFKIASMVRNASKKEADKFIDLAK